MVDVTGQAANVARNLRYRGAGAVREFASRLVYSVRSTTDPEPVLSADWDVLVVLDACRADLFAGVVADADYDFLPDGGAGTRVSPASSTKEWLRTVFGGADDAQLADVAYVSGNPFTSSEIDASRFHAVEDVWLDEWDDDRGTIPPRPVTDRAIRTRRDGDADRLVVHYMQPHFPSLAATDGGGVTLTDFGTQQLSVWDDLRFGRRTADAVWREYRQNLEYVLDELDVLFSNLDADRAVVTSDHGNAFGERGLYGHPAGVDVPCLREVPWCVTTATDTRSREPAAAAAELADEPDDEERLVAERLEDLGYRT